MPGTLKPRPLLRVVLPVLMALAVLLAAATTQPNSALAQGGQVTIGISAPIESFQPYGYSVSFFPLYNQFYNVLVRLDANHSPQPELAESWVLSADSKVLTLQLRKGVRFHSGRELEAQDVLRSWQRATQRDTPAINKGLFRRIARVEVVDRYLLRLHLRQPTPGLFDLLDQLWIIDDDQYGRAASIPIGTGPFALVEHLPGERLILQPFANYWRPGKPLLQQVKLQIIQDPEALISSLRAGRLDAVGQVRVQDVEALQAAGVLVESASEGLFYNVMFNNAEGRFAGGSNPLHQVFVHALDRNRFVRETLAGKSRPLCMPWLPTSPAYDAAFEASCGYDPALARSYLADATAAMGIPAQGMEVTLWTSSQWYYGLRQLAERLQSDLGQLGISAQIEDVETANYARVHNSGGFEVILSLTGRANRDPVDMLTLTSTMRARGNAARYDNPDFNALVDQAARTVDPAQRRAVFEQINTILRRDMYTMPVATAPFLFAHQRRLQDLRFSVDGFVFLEEARLR